eukprot:SM000146S00968  [mRNA]  locus=s146:248517:252421:+ [translate_table: standard]
MQALQLRLPAAAPPATKSRRNEQPPPGHHCLPPPAAQLGGRLVAQPGLLRSARRQRVRPPKWVRDAGTSVGTTMPDLTAYVTQGPLWPKLGLQPDDMERQLLSLPLLAVHDGLLRSEMDKWQQLGQQLAEQLGFDKGGALDESQRCRLYRYYVPAFLWCLKQLEQYQQQSGGAAADRKPLVVGISAPQGCGKSTLVESLEYLFNKSSRKAASISIDDFYLRAADQEALRDANPGNQLLELRGNAGSHDLALGMATLKALKGLSKPGAKFRVPRYNKSARAGKGDRADTSTWPEVEGPLEIVLFEGWMLGFEPLPMEKVANVDPQAGTLVTMGRECPRPACAVSAQLVVVNDKLADYAAWHNEVDAWIIIEVDDPNWVFDWRLQVATIALLRGIIAEVAMRNKGKPGMTDEQVADFVSTYMPAYKAYLPQLYSRGPQHAESEKTLKLVIDKGRNPIG